MERNHRGLDLSRRSFHRLFLGMASLAIAGRAAKATGPSESTLEGSYRIPRLVGEQDAGAPVSESRLLCFFPTFETPAVLALSLPIFESLCDWRNRISETSSPISLLLQEDIVDLIFGSAVIVTTDGDHFSIPFELLDQPNMEAEGRAVVTSNGLYAKIAAQNETGFSFTERHITKALHTIVAALN